MDKNEMRLKWLAEHSPASYRDIVKARFEKTLVLLKDQVEPRLKKRSGNHKNWTVIGRCPHCGFAGGFFSCNRCLWPDAMGIKNPKPNKIYCWKGIKFGGVSMEEIGTGKTEYVTIIMSCGRVFVDFNWPSSPRESEVARAEFAKAEAFCVGHLDWADKYQWGKRYGQKD